MTDYFELYKTILLTIRENKPSDAQQLFDHLSNTEYIRNELSLKNPDIVEDTIDTLDNLLDDGLIKGKRFSTKNGIVYSLSGLTTLGRSYLMHTSDKTFSDKLKEYLKENGIPMSAANITKCIAKLTL